mmetsp:Transcript_22787/g.77062  ORF Transcript_22787/g.77062 Transcript_22787/m.77062 type:complete len:211 (+) Transcript_22787:32-664(+)
MATATSNSMCAWTRRMMASRASRAGKSGRRPQPGLCKRSPKSESLDPCLRTTSGGRSAALSAPKADSALATAFPSSKMCFWTFSAASAAASCAAAAPKTRPVRGGSPEERVGRSALIADFALFRPAKLPMEVAVDCWNEGFSSSKCGARSWCKSESFGNWIANSAAGSPSSFGARRTRSSSAKTRIISGPCAKCTGNECTPKIRGTGESR